MESKPKPWERAPGETDHAWAAFELFRDMAYPEGLAGDFVPRNVAALAERTGTARSSLMKWLGANGWHVRAASFDRHVDGLRLKAKRKSLDLVTDAHKRLLGTLRETLENELAKYADASNKDACVTLATFERTASMLADVIKSDRLVHGGTTENTGQGIQASDPTAPAWDLDALDLEDLEKLDELRRKAGAREPKPSGE